MKERKLETENGSAKPYSSIPRPPPLPLPRFWVQKTTTESVTNREIAKFWKQKRIEEEDHLLAAIKVAARARARNLTEDAYKQFEDSLKDDNEIMETMEEKTAARDSNPRDEKKEVRVGIKDWWTKSKYKYLNRPAINSMDHPKRTSNYIPNYFSFKPTPPYPTTLGVF